MFKYDEHPRSASRQQSEAYGNQEKTCDGAQTTYDNQPAPVYQEAEHRHDADAQSPGSTWAHNGSDFTNSKASWTTHLGQDTAQQHQITRGEGKNRDEDPYYSIDRFAKSVDPQDTPWFSGAFTMNARIERTREETRKYRENEGSTRGSNQCEHDDQSRRSGGSGKRESESGRSRGRSSGRAKEGVQKSRRYKNMSDK